jgi:GDP-L-fucose synthase
MSESLMSDFWRARKVLVTGGSGFIGSHVVDRLLSEGAQVTAAAFGDLSNLDGVRDRIRLADVDLTRLDVCLEMCRDQSVVLNIAHVDGSAAFKKARPAYILRQNMSISLNMMEAAGKSHVERFLVMSSAEVYPHDAADPTPETQAFLDMADRPTDGYTWSKRMSELSSRIYAAEYGIKMAIARPNNVYGPRDYFDDDKGRVIPMFIKRAVEGEPIVIWGTGETIRTFLYVEDLARGLIDLVEKYPEGDPVNLGGEQEISLRELAELVVRISGSKTEIVCDAKKPSGAPRRTSDVSKARRVLGFRPTVPLESGLRRTIEGYLSRAAEKASPVPVPLP